MKTFSIEEHELMMWQREVKAIGRRVDKQQEKVDNDPAMIMMDCELKFRQMLESNLDRNSTEFKKKFYELNTKQAKAKKDFETWDAIAEMDRLSDLKLQEMQIQQRFETLNFRHRMRHKM